MRTDDRRGKVVECHQSTGTKKLPVQRKCTEVCVHAVCMSAYTVSMSSSVHTYCKYILKRVCA